LTLEVTRTPNQLIPERRRAERHDPHGPVYLRDQRTQCHRHEDVHVGGYEQVIEQNHPAADEAGEWTESVARIAVNRSGARYRLGHDRVALGREVHADRRQNIGEHDQAVGCLPDEAEGLKYAERAHVGDAVNDQVVKRERPAQRLHRPTFVERHWCVGGVQRPNAFSRLGSMISIQ
jgi:hypothetical protein